MIAGTTYCLACTTTNGGTAAIYLNGTQRGVLSAGTLQAGAGDCFIACRNSVDLFATMQASDALIFDSVLTPTQIAAIAALRL
jgi:hypothetical protein